MTNNTSKILEKVDGHQGYYDELKLSSDDISKLTEIVHDHFSSQLASKYPEASAKIKNTKMNMANIIKEIKIKILQI